VKKSFTAAQIESMQTALRTLPDTEEGRGVLKNIGIDGFDTRSEKRLRDLLAWLGI